MRSFFFVLMVRATRTSRPVLAILGALTLLATLGRGNAWAASDVFAPYWVTTGGPTHLWSGSDRQAIDYGSVAIGSALLVVSPPAASRLFVYVPATRNYAYVDAIGVTTGHPITQTNAWHGRVAGGLYVRAAPSRRATLLNVLPARSLVQVVAWVEGEEVVSGDWTWARFADGTYGYGEALLIVPPSSAPSPPLGHPTGRWIDVNLLQQTVTAYEGSAPVHLAIASTGSPGWETSIGTHPILRRVPDERMRGSTLVLSPDRRARATYDIPHVRYTQYLSASGEALHENYWLADNQFGIPHSHGCIGLRTADAAWFWSWAAVGTPVVAHAS